MGRLERRGIIDDDSTALHEQYSLFVLYSGYDQEELDEVRIEVKKYNALCSMLWESAEAGGSWNLGLLRGVVYFFQHRHREKK